MRDFHDSDHANNRLSRCFIAYLEDDGEWQVSRISNATKTKIFTTCGRDFPMNSKLIKFVFPKLGYVNTGSQCIYLTRSSKRMWKVGLTPENIITDYLHRNFVTHKDQKSYENMIEDICNKQYYTPKKALELILKGKRSGSAFSSKFCFGLSEKTLAPVLYYKNKSVGYYDANYKAIVISDVNSHIIQQLNEALGDSDIKVIT